MHLQEKEIARMVTLAFGQKVCGFDLLRSERARSFVCDVNGWSFVKNSHKVGSRCSGHHRHPVFTGKETRPVCTRIRTASAAVRQWNNERSAACQQAPSRQLFLLTPCALCTTAVLRRRGRDPAQHHPQRHRAAPAVHAARAHARLLHHARPGVGHPAAPLWPRPVSAT